MDKGAGKKGKKKRIKKNKAVCDWLVERFRMNEQEN